MGLALLLIIWLITFVSTWIFIQHPAWLWLPPVASSYGPLIDDQFFFTYILRGIVFVAAQVALGLFAWKYRERASRSTALYSHGNNTLEIIWTVLTAILFIGLNLMSSSIWASERFRPAEPGALQVEVTG